MCDLSTSIFRLAKLVFSAKHEVSTCVTFFRSVFAALLERWTFTLMFPPKLLNGLGKYWLICNERISFLKKFHSRSFSLIQQLNELSYSFHLTYNLSSFLLSTFSILTFSWLVFLQFFFIKNSSNRFTIQIINNICPRDCIFNFANNKNFF